ncbi:hypothetical protein U0070_005188, partial [Myodes glareolus]
MIANGLSVERVRGDLQGVKGPTEHLGASLLLVIPTSVQLGDTWILQTVASRFQVVRFVNISRIQMSLLLFMRDSLSWSCAVLSLLLGSLTLEHLSFGSRRETDLLSQGTESTFHMCKREPRATSRKLKMGSGACTGQQVTLLSECSLGYLERAGASDCSLSAVELHCGVPAPTRLTSLEELACTKLPRNLATPQFCVTSVQPTARLVYKDTARLWDVYGPYKMTSELLACMRRLQPPSLVSQSMWVFEIDPKTESDRSTFATHDCAAGFWVQFECGLPCFLALLVLLLLLTSQGHPRNAQSVRVPINRATHTHQSNTLRRLKVGEAHWCPWHLLGAEAVGALERQGPFLICHPLEHQQPRASTEIAVIVDESRQGQASGWLRPTVIGRQRQLGLDPDSNFPFLPGSLPPTLPTWQAVPGKWPSQQEEAAVDIRRNLSSKVGHGLQALLPRPAAGLRSHDFCGALVGWGWSVVLVEVCAQPSPETGQSERAFYLLSSETLSVAFLNHALPHYRSLKPTHIPPPSTQLQDINTGYYRIHRVLQVWLGLGPGKPRQVGKLELGRGEAGNGQQFALRWALGSSAARGFEMQCPLLAHLLTQRCLFPGAFTAPKSLCLKASIIQLQGTLWTCLPDYKQRGELRAKGMPTIEAELWRTCSPALTGILSLRQEAGRSSAVKQVLVALGEEE